MKYKIGVIWSSNITDKEKYPDNIIIFDNIKMVDTNKVFNELLDKNVNAIVVTAGIANVLNKNINAKDIHIVIGYPSYIDVLETLNFMESSCGITGEKIGIVLQRSNIFHLDRIAAFSKNKLSLIYFDNLEQLEDIVNKLPGEGYYGIITGPTAEQIGNRIGLKTFPLSFHSKIFEGALAEAEALILNTHRENLFTRKLGTIVNMFEDPLIVTDKSGNINFCNAQASKMLTGIGKGQIDNVNVLFDKDNFELECIDNFIEIDGNKYFMQKQEIKMDKENYGRIIRFQEISNIQHLEQRYRNIQNSGLFARYKFKDIIYKSSKMHDVIELAKISSVYDYTVLIYGETGTGKEMIAQSIHNESSRKYEAFVALNCAAITETLLESELFGYEEGAFTGAKKGGKIGLFERAHKGSVFLDEISQMPLSIQAKVLRVIQEKSVRRVGSDKIIPVDVRIIAASNERLSEKVKNKEFRGDLYYRLGVIELEIPPLRERREDIPLLIEYFLKNFNFAYDEDKSISKADINKLSGLNWPGNIRELENYIVRMCIMKQLYKPNLESDFDKDGDFGNKSDCFMVRRNTLKMMERQLIEEVLRECKGNKTMAGKMLEISRNTIKQKLSL